MIQSDVLEDGRAMGEHLQGTWLHQLRLGSPGFPFSYRTAVDGVELRVESGFCGFRMDASCFTINEGCVCSKRVLIDHT